MSHASSAATTSPPSDLTLHICPPAFGLPSSDPACLAAVAYISNSVPRGDWALVAGTPDEVGVSELPALITKNATIEGLDAILTYLRTHYTDLDSRLPSPIARADAIAFTSQLLTTLPPLLALSLYVSSPNYTTTTRRAISSPLPFPLAYTIPPSLRAAAKLRSQHLGLSSLDLDAISAADDAPLNPAMGIIPQHLLSGMRKGVTVTIQEERAGLRFRLDGLVDQACAPLARLLGDKRYFLSNNEEEGMSSLDAVALGFLALALMPKLPQPWLKEGLKRYPTLTAFVERGIRDTFGGDVTPATARGEGGGGGSMLPWKASTPHPLFSRVGTAVVGQIVEGTPFAASKIKIKPKGGDVEAEAHSLATTLMLPVAVSGAAVAAVVGGVMVYAGSAAGNTGRSLREMGEAGAIFGGMDLGGAGAGGGGGGGGGGDGGGGGMNGSGQQGNRSGKVEVDAVGVEM